MVRPKEGVYLCLPPTTLLLVCRSSKIGYWTSDCFLLYSPILLHSKTWPISLFQTHHLIKFNLQGHLCSRYKTNTDTSDLCDTNSIWKTACCSGNSAGPLRGSQVRASSTISHMTPSTSLFPLPLGRKVSSLVWSQSVLTKSDC